jgi:hypothetical protein
LANFSNSSILKTPNKNENFYQRMEKHHGGPPVDVKYKIWPFRPQVLCWWGINMHIDVQNIKGGHNVGEKHR